MPCATGSTAHFIRERSTNGPDGPWPAPAPQPARALTQARTRVGPRPRSQPLKARIRLVRGGCRRHYLAVGPAPVGAIYAGPGGAAMAVDGAGNGYPRSCDRDGRTRG